ncbi:MAG: sigma-54-dependent Fis family transcriptional regulator [Betaproteobacteria bacterium HGW-Betaproteobacteria-7]|jgi:DNA-binding NtrC family response regulator|nr:MAG: sigma-54-dependent Fis family transcriptional regulator [Betaproteobacteria bacterium HGW-Betaproteobacteria-7]
MATPSEPRLRLCLIEDDVIMGESLSQRFQLEGFDVDWWRTAREATAALEGRRYGVVVSDIRLPDRNGGDLFLELSARLPMLPPFLFMTAFGSIDRAVELLKAGAADYIAKPFEADLLVLKVRGLAEEYGTLASGEVGLLGVSPAMRRIADTLPRLARHASALLITGESGVGKEHVAREFHRQACASASPFVAVNCAAIPESLLEAELFGFDKGAFTGAGKTKRGYIEQAGGGTLFLDEIGEMPLAMQSKLLRVVQERSIVRVGGEGAIPVDFRLVCATHRDLKEMVERGQFREDLYYRIHVIQVRIPPLRERQDDIRWFLRHYVETFNRANPQETRRIDPGTEQVLALYAWPGNIRELKHAVERACILSPGPLLDAEAFFGDSLDSGDGEGSASPSLSEYLLACEKNYLQIALEKHAWHMTHTAEALGISRKTLWEKMRRLGMQNAALAPDDNA